MPAPAPLTPLAPQPGTPLASTAPANNSCARRDLSGSQDQVAAASIPSADRFRPEGIEMSPASPRQSCTFSRQGGSPAPQSPDLPQTRSSTSHRKCPRRLLRQAHRRPPKSTSPSAAQLPKSQAFRRSPAPPLPLPADSHHRGSFPPFARHPAKPKNSYPAANQKTPGPRSKTAATRR